MKIKVPGDAEYSHQISFTVVEDIEGMGVHRLIKDWEKKIADYKTGRGEKKKDIEGTLIMSRMDRQHNQKITYTLRGVYLEDYDVPQMNEEGTVAQITLMFSYDYFEEPNIK